MTINNALQISSYYDLTTVEKLDLLIQISKPENFFLLYFNNLPYADSKAECFLHLNDLHYEIYGQYMYSDYNSFRNSYANFIKRRRKS